LLFKYRYDCYFRINPTLPDDEVIELLLSNKVECNAAFSHAGLTTSYRTKSLYKNIFALSRSRNIVVMKRIKSLLKIAGMKSDFKSWEIRFYKRQVSFLVVKTVKCIRGIDYKK